MSESKHTLAERVEQFNCMELPGQPMMMHMGTSYLVNDLWRSHREMQETLRWVRKNYASGSTREINERIDAAIAKAEGR